MQLLELHNQHYILFSNLIYSLQYEEVGQILHLNPDEPTETTLLVVHNQKYMVVDHIICSEDGNELGILLPMT